MIKNSEIIKVRWSDEVIAARKEFRCVHGHSGLTHPNCYVLENDIQERKAILDIECGGLDAGFDIVYCYALKPIGGITIYDNITKEDFNKGIQDARILDTLCHNLWNFDRLILHYGSNRRFDLPFLRTRIIRMGIQDFPKPGEMYVTDTYAMAKSLLRLTSNRQNRVASAILGYDEKTAIDHEYWRQMKYGTTSQRKEATKYVVDHCVHDVSQCEQIYEAMLPYFAERKTSI